MTLHTGALSRTQTQAVEWPTLFTIVGCYAGWATATAFLYPIAPVVTIVLTGILIALHASLTHEVLHGHPFRSKRANEALVFLSLNLWLPYNRFRDLHLAHHRDQSLTDPYDDPETNFLDPDVWGTLPAWLKLVFRINNTLLGRIVIGPVIGQLVFMRSDWQAARAGDRTVWLAWALHVPGVLLVLAWVILATDMPIWAYLISAHIGLGLLKIRTFLEHQAHDKARARTVIIEDRGPLAFLFLNNNLHVVHHMHPRVPWYRLPKLYQQNKARYLNRNESYMYRSYAEIFGKYLFRAKDPVPHPLWKQP